MSQLTRLNCLDQRRAFPEVAPAANWFALYTSSRHEKKVARHLSTRKIEHFLPLYRSQRRWNDGSKVELELPLFPSYVFVRLDRRERARVLEVPGALMLVAGTGGEPAAFEEKEIDMLRSGINLCRMEPHPLLRSGQRARIRSGPLAGIEGIIERIRNGFRVVLTFEIIMKSIAVEVDANNLDIVAA